MAIRASSAKQIAALVADLASASATTRDGAVARLTVIGSRAVERLLVVVESEAAPDTRALALRALESIGDVRALGPALRACGDPDVAVRSAAIEVAQAFLQGPHGTAALDRLTSIAVDRQCENSVRVAAVRSLGLLEPDTLAPLWKALAGDENAEIRAIAGMSVSQKRSGARFSSLEGAPRRDPRSGRTASRPDANPSRGDLLAAAAEGIMPDDPESLRRALAESGDTVALSVLHRIVERIRDREAAESPAERPNWTRARGAAHVALANRRSRLGLYDIREALERAREPLPVEFLAALLRIGDASCLVAIAAAHAQSSDGWWRSHLEDAFHAIVMHEGITRRHAVARRIAKRWGKKWVGESW